MLDEIEKSVRDGVFVFNNAFSSDITENEFYNKHFENPYKISQPVRLLYEADTPIGLNAFMGMYILDNAANTKHYVVQSNDSAVLPQSRGKHVFTRIVMGFEESDSECEYCIGIPNDKSYNGFLRMGWKNVAELRTLSLTRKKITLLKQPRNIDYGEKIREGIEFCLRSQYDFSESELEKINASSDVITQRSNKYVNWKISNQKGFVLSAYDDADDLRGYLIFHILRRNKYGLRYNQICIDDWFYNDLIILKKLIDQVVKYGYYVYIPHVNLANEEYKNFVKCGFVDELGQKSAFLIVSPRGFGHDYLARFSYRELDGDYILNTQ